MKKLTYILITSTLSLASCSKDAATPVFPKQKNEMAKEVSVSIKGASMTIGGPLKLY
ncbi:hypothetical protein QE390_003757 [Siphonobacter sp. SORGH_AS 1065]|nr:hypothetical protein [Siphonobacter sp. SORGH_AS_1065]